MLIELDLYGFIKKVDVHDVIYDKGYVEARVEPGLQNLMAHMGNEPVKKPFGMILRFRRVDEKRFVYEPAL